MGWLAGWGKRVKLTIDQNDIDAALSDFPVLVYLSTSSGRGPDDVSFVFDELVNDANRKKIAVTKSDGTTECYVEIEQWDDDNEQAWLWVKVPDIASGDDTDLYLYYDVSHADNDAHVGDPSDAVVHNVWDSNFVFVSHMRNDPDTSHIRDSTVNANDGTKKAASNPNEVAGYISRGQYFDGDDHIHCPDSAVFDFAAGFTLEVLADPDQTDADRRLLQRYDSGSRDGYHLSQSPSGAGLWMMTVYVNAAEGYAYSNNPPSGAFQHVVGVRSAAGLMTIYVDGAAQAPGSTRAGAIDSNGLLYIGSNFTGAGTYFLGIEDEVRLSDIERPAEWIKATWESARDDLLGFGSEELQPTVRVPRPPAYGLDPMVF